MLIYARSLTLKKRVMLLYARSLTLKKRVMLVYARSPTQDTQTWVLVLYWHGWLNITVSLWWQSASILVYYGYTQLTIIYQCSQP